MKVILYGAVSLDGFIATVNGDSDWALDDVEFEESASKIGCILIGRKTYEQYLGETYPLNNVINFVYTNHSKKLMPLMNKQVRFIGGSAPEVLHQISEAGFDTVLLGGGAETNGTFARAGLIDEMILDVHPLILGQGMRLLGDYTEYVNLKLISSHDNPKGFVQNHYHEINSA